MFLYMFTLNYLLLGLTLEWVAISFSKAWKWKAKVKSLSLVRLFVTPWTAYQAPPPMGFSRQEHWSGLPLPSPRLNIDILMKSVSWLSKSQGNKPSKNHWEEIPDSAACDTVGQYINVIDDQLMCQQAKSDQTSYKIHPVEGNCTLSESSWIEVRSN